MSDIRAALAAGDRAFDHFEEGACDLDEVCQGLVDFMVAEISGGVGGLADGDYGDITVGGSGTTMTIDNDAVTYAKIQDVSATDRLLGRDTAGSGIIEELTVGSGLAFTGSGGIDVATAGVTNAMLANMATQTFKGRTTAGTGDPEDLSIAQAKALLDVDDLESEIVVLEAAQRGVFYFSTGSSWGTSTTRVYAFNGINETDALATTERRLLLPFDVEILGMRFVTMGGAGTGAATITFTLRANQVDTAFTMTTGNTTSNSAGQFQDWSSSPLAMSAGDQLSIAVNKSTTITAGGARGQFVVVYRKV